MVVLAKWYQKSLNLSPDILVHVNIGISLSTMTSCHFPSAIFFYLKVQNLFHNTHFCLVYA